VLAYEINITELNSMEKKCSALCTDLSPRQPEEPEWKTNSDHHHRWDGYQNWEAQIPMQSLAPHTVTG